MIQVSEAIFEGFGLTPKEMAIVTLLLEGKRTAEISAACWNTKETIKTQLAHIREKTGARDMAGIVCALWLADQETP
jgi:DNA-binding CsgD family transcriptional regulator